MIGVYLFIIRRLVCIIHRKGKEKEVRTDGRVLYRTKPSGLEEEEGYEVDIPSSYIMCMPQTTFENQLQWLRLLLAMKMIGS